MRVSILLFISLFIAHSSFSADREKAYEKVCKSLFSEYNRLACIKKINSHEFFNDTALQICANFFSTESRLRCIPVIGDKDYRDFELNHCKNIFSDSSTLECLESTGTLRQRRGPCIEEKILIQELEAVYSNLIYREFREAGTKLSLLINRLKSCIEVK